jgi:hypothetical protein
LLRVFKIFTACFLSALILHVADSFGQTRPRCGLLDFTGKLRQSNFLNETEQGFEQWINQKKDLRRRIKQQSRQKESIYHVPVVVHIIHNGEPIGTGSNISDAQILSQIQVLNEDFQRLNPDTASTPSDFKSVAGGMTVQFSLAKRTPTGGASNGIVRVNGGRLSWGMNNDAQLKALSYWPAEDYLNIWVCNITDFLGYAQFPISNLPGLEDSDENRLTDGVVIWYKSFGSVDHGNFVLNASYNKGRTTTHEVGHFFGLRHIWGDLDNCNGTDYVEDTPVQKTNNSGCPSHPHRTCTPAVVNMFQNYMDYSNDVCMNLFTAKQVERMETVIENSPRRASLLTSAGLLPPEPVNNDIGFRRLLSPHETECGEGVVPVITLQNFGKNTVTSALLRVKVNGQLVETKNISISLDPQDSLTVSFNELNFSSGTNTVSFEIVLTNGVTDGDDVNNENALSTTVIIPKKINLPFEEKFSGMPEGWIPADDNSNETWSAIQIMKDFADDEALAVPLGETESIGSYEVLFTPVFDLSNATSPLLYFDHAYASDYAAFHDENVEDFSRLRIAVISNCGVVDEGTIVFEKSGEELARLATRGDFIPNGADDWTTEQIDLSQFIGLERLQLAFIAVAGNGNTLYLDNVVLAEDLLDVKLKQVSRPGLVTCDGTKATLAVENTGNIAVQSVNVNYRLNNGKEVVKHIGGLQVLPGQVENILVDEIPFHSGENLISFSVSEPNGGVETFTGNNTATIKVVLDEKTDKIPLRQNFDDDLAEEWLIKSPVSDFNFKPTELGEPFDKAIYFPGFTNEHNGGESWLVTPVLDFSNATEASLLFDLSNANAAHANEFRILVSENCGITYQELYYELPVNATWRDVGWIPDDENDWTQPSYVDLSSLGGKDSIRLAFVSIQANGNNLYLDNFEFFTAKDQRDIAVEPGYQIFGYDPNNMANSTLKVGFNLKERRNVMCEVFDTMGKAVGSARWDDVLNQIFDLPFGRVQNSGSYIVRMNVGGQYTTRLVVIAK